LKKVNPNSFSFWSENRFFDKMIFIKILNKHLEMTKVIFFIKKNGFFLKVNPKQTHPISFARNYKD